MIYDAIKLRDAKFSGTKNQIENLLRQERDSHYPLDKNVGINYLKNIEVLYKTSCKI